MTHRTEIAIGAPGRFGVAKVADATAGSLKLGSVLSAEWGDINRLGARLAYRRYGAAVRGLWTFARCRTREDIVAAQAAMVGEDLELIKGACERAGEIVAQAAGDAVRTIARPA